MILAGVFDVVMVVVFVMIGRAAHDEPPTPLGFLVTLWPFLVALVLGWLVARAWRRPLRLWPTGVLVWVVTVVGGLLLRLVSGQGTATAFVIVTTITLAVLLLGWRLIAWLAKRRMQTSRNRGSDTPRQ